MIRAIQIFEFANDRHTRGFLRLSEGSLKKRSEAGLHSRVQRVLPKFYHTAARHGGPRCRSWNAGGGHAEEKHGQQLGNPRS